MLPVSSNGELRVTFTKPVSWPESILATIDVEKLVGLTFEPKTYDYETDEDGKTTELTSWEIVRIQLGPTRLPQMAPRVTGAGLMVSSARA